MAMLENLPLLSILVAVLLAIMASLLRKRKGGTPFPFPPCPPILGHYYQLFPWDGSPGRNASAYDWLVECAAAYGPCFAIRLPLSELMPSAIINVTTDPKNVEHMLKTNFENYPKGPNFLDIMRDLLGDGIFNADGPCWNSQRKTASHEFSISRFKQFMSSVFLDHALELCTILGARLDKQTDLQRLFSKLTLDSIGEIAYGVKLGCLQNDMLFERAFDDATHLSSLRFLQPWWKISRLLSVGSERRLAESIRVIDGFSQEVIARRRAQTEDELSAHSDLLSRFMQQTDELGKPHTDKYLRDIVVNFVLAGRDTTSNALSWLFLSLARHPRVLREVRREMDEAGVSDAGAVPSFERVHHSQMPYLHAVATETLRLFPSVPVDPKYCVADDVMPTGHFVAAGTQMSYSPYAMGRSEAIWGNDAAEFRPERHLKCADSNGAGEGVDEGAGSDGAAARRQFVKPSPFMFTAFQAGKRTCLGMDMSYLEIKTVVVALLQRFDFKVAADHREGYVRSLTLPLHELRMSITALRSN